MYSTEHSRMRFIQRVKGITIPKRNKQKFIEQYIKKAFKEGLTPKEIKDPYLRDYMYGKMKQDVHYLSATKITHYKGNLFLFRNHTCITVLDVPKRAENSVDDIIYITKLHPFINRLKEKKNVKKWLHDNGKHLEKIKDLKRCIVVISDKNLTYNYLMNKFPLRAIKYIKNDSEFKKAIIKINKKRKLAVKEKYYFVYALLLLIPKSQILKLQTILKNNKNSIFYIINNEEITKKQLDLCYKQLFIILSGDLKPRYNKFNVNDNLCYDIINDHFINIINDYINTVKDIFKDRT